MALKKYQQKTIEVLHDYLTELNKVGPEYAFMKLTKQPYKDAFFKQVPFVCIKIPTGGGKTLVAAHATNEILETTLRDKLNKGIVMWFVPSEAIKSQTLSKLKSRNDIHRKVLDEAFDNKVRIFSNEEALRIRKEDVENNLCIIISSLDAFRKEKSIQSKYKVYQENGELISHFENSDDDKIFEKDEAGTVINSLANVIRKSNPLIVIDEGHHSQTELSIDFLKDLNPAFIIEFTATPRGDSNVLIQIHSADLKEEKMVKIPIILESVSQWQQAVTRGILKRKELEGVAKKEKGEYIRPIALLQAEQEKENPEKITVSKIKDFLMKEHKIPEEEIAVKTSSTNDIEGIDLFDKKCPIRFIITVNALAEGWDCSYAYLLISVANIGSRISVEQIIGRIVRLPNQKSKKQPELNYSYVFASAKNFNEAANQIITGLEKNGYSRHDVVNVSERDKKDECEISRVIKEDVSVPIMAFDGEPLDFSDLIGEDFELAKQNCEFKFATHYDNDGRITLDIKEGDQWVRERQTILNLVYADKNFSKSELISWLDKRLRFIILDQVDKKKFIEKAVNYQLSKYSLSELSVNRFVLRDKLDAVIKELLQKYAKKRFDEYVKKKITVKPFEKFDDKIIVSEKIDEKFKKNYYEEVEKLNKEELAFIQRLDSEALPNIKFWVRNREKKDPFYIQGWKQNKFYPDFIAVTKKGNILALEWKGQDRLSNEDTEYKVEAAKVWAELGKGKLHFFLVSNDSVEKVLNAIKEL
jgi:superfamily II DNA or RNA helicase